VFDWDRHNEQKLKRHDITREEAQQVMLNDPFFQYPQDAGDEQRELYLGETDSGRLLAVALTIRGDRIRIVTAYDMDADQKQRYLQYRLEQQS
jgi:uncharacterized DUF497 family protein